MLLVLVVVDIIKKSMRFKNFIIQVLVRHSFYKKCYAIIIFLIVFHSSMSKTEFFQICLDNTSMDSYNVFNSL